MTRREQLTTNMDQLHNNLDLTQTHSRVVSVVEVSIREGSPPAVLILRTLALCSAVDVVPEALKQIYLSNFSELLVVRKEQVFVVLLEAQTLRPA
jgi:hypothetical protein